MGDMTASLWFIKAVIALLTLILAVLVGMQFPLANRLEFDGTVAGASHLYTADFVGAFLGALLASTLLIPLVGVTGVCLLTAALNILGGVMIQFRKAIT
jgi:predicted membrane-bound spermidine synthase